MQELLFQRIIEIHKIKILRFKKIFFVLPPSDNDLKVKNLLALQPLQRWKKVTKIFCHTIQRLPKELVKISIIGKGWNSYVLKLKQMI